MPHQFPTVLIVDPDESTRHFVRDMLAKLEIATIEAETVEQTRAALVAGHSVHVALLEVNLPHVPGDVLAEEMVRAGVVPILMTVSDYGNVRGRRTQFPLLRKPFTVKDALREIIRALPDRR